jgi:hypothetical protein
MSSLSTAARVGGAQDLGASQSLSRTQWPWGNEAPSKPDNKFVLDPAAKERIVVEAFSNAVRNDPELLKKPIAEAARFISVPPAALQSAFEKLADQTGGRVKLVDGRGAPRPMGDILRSLPPEQAGAIVSKWYQSLPPAVQQVLAGVGIGLVLATEGPKGLAQRLKLNLEIVKGSDGKLALSLIPNSKGAGVLGQVSGELRIPIDAKGQIALAGSVRSDTTAQLTAGLKMALGGSTFTVNGKLETDKTATLTGGLAVPVGGDTKLNLGVALGDKPVAFSAGLSGTGWSVKGQASELGFGLEGQLRLSF